MRGSSSTRWAIGTLAVVAIALSVDSLRRTRAMFAPTRAPQIAIRGQLEAFNRNDYRAAYRYAAPEIQEMYPLSAFRRMVEEGYPELSQWRQLSLGVSSVHGDTVAVPVAVTSKNGTLAHFIYSMRHEATGWRVAGVERDHTHHPLRGYPPRHPGARPRPARRPERVPAQRVMETTAIDPRLRDG
jgi:Domain of unknown function (DUF4864)